MAAVAVVVGGRLGSTPSGVFLQSTAVGGGVRGGAGLGRRTEAVTDLGRFSSGRSPLLLPLSSWAVMVRGPGEWFSRLMSNSAWRICLYGLLSGSCFIWSAVEVAVTGGIVAIVLVSSMVFSAFSLSSCNGLACSSEV